MAQIWSRLIEFAELYLIDSARFQMEAKPLVEADGVSWRSFEADVKRHAKMIKKDREAAEVEERRLRKMNERQDRQMAAASAGAPQMEHGSPAEVAQLLAKYLADKHMSPPVFDEGHFWVYEQNTGAWCVVADGELHATIHEWDRVSTVGADAKPFYCADAEKPVKMMAADLTKKKLGPGYFKGRQVGIAFRDRFIGIKNNQISAVPHSPENRCRFALPFSIRDAQIEGSRFEQMQIQQFGSLNDPRCKLLWEFVGYCLLGKITAANQALILFGPGGSGKGTLLRIIQACFPADSVGSIQPQRWTHGASLDVLARIRLNAVNEMNTDDLSDVGRFKAVISGDLIEAEPKYKTPYSFCPSAGHIFTVNPGQLPTVPDADEPFWDRWICVPVERVYRGTAEQDTGLAQHIIDHELHIVVAHAIAVAVAAIKRNRFTKCPQGEEVIREWREGVNPVAQFLAERTVPFDGNAYRNAPLLSEVFVEYQKWCLEAGHKPSSRTVLGRRLRALGRLERSNGARVLVRMLKPYELNNGNDLDEDDPSPI